MKHFIIISLLFVNALGVAQSDVNSPEMQSQYNLHDLGMSVTVDSLEELESMTINENIIQLADLASGDEKITFQLTWNYKQLEKGVKFYKSYEVVGQTSEMEALLVLIDKMKDSAIKDYKKFESHE